MNRLHKNEKGFSAVETVLALMAVILIGVAGYMVYRSHHKTAITTTSTATETPPISQQAKGSGTANNRPSQQYLTIKEWGVRVPYNGSDMLSLSAQSCVENGDTNGDTVSLGCQVAITSKDLAGSVDSCTAKVGGTVGYFYRMGANDNYSATNGSGYTPVAEWAAQNPGQYTKIGSYYYAFDEIGRATGVSGAAVADSNEMNGTYTGCGAWQSKYKTVEKQVQPLAAKFEAISN